MRCYLGIDVGSVSTNIVALDNKMKVIQAIYLRTNGDPLKSVKTGLKQINTILPRYTEISGVGVTGSARYLIGTMVGADIIKNEITAHAVASSSFFPDARTIIEIGGQDSKIIILKEGIVTDFAMNNVCAAGTGSFLDQQASRLAIPIEDFGARALKSKTDISIAGRCTVFAESDMIHKQQLGYSLDDILKGLCKALVRNYFNTVGKGKEINDRIIFQGGVAANKGIKKAFEEYLKKKLTIPKYYNVMGAIGSAIIAKESITNKSRFKGFIISDNDFKTRSFSCKDCQNHCEIIEFFEDNKKIAEFGDKCGKYNN